MLHFEQGYIEQPQPKSQSRDIDFPVSRVKKIMTLDPEVNKIQKNAVLAVIAATKQFVCRLSQAAAHASNLSGRKQISYRDLVSTIYRNPEFEFLQLDFRRAPKTDEPPKKARVRSATLLVWNHTALPQK